MMEHARAGPVSFLNSCSNSNLLNSEKKFTENETVRPVSVPVQVLGAAFLLFLFMFMCIYSFKRVCECTFT